MVCAGLVEAAIQIARPVDAAINRCMSFVPSSMRGLTYSAFMTIWLQFCDNGARSELTADGWRATRPVFHPRLDPRQPQVLVFDVLERDRHYFAATIDCHVTEELQPEAGSKIIH